MSDRKPPTVESLERGGNQEFRQEKRRFTSTANSMENIAFRALEFVDVVGQNVEIGVTNYFELYETDLICINGPFKRFKLRVLELGQFVLLSS